MDYYLTHYYKPGTKPFRSLSALPDIEAFQIMKDLYTENVIWGRFKDPVNYLKNRRQTEKWVREEFILKGGRPQEEYPIYMVLGSSNWIERNSLPEDDQKIEIPLSVFQEADLSFTYPDSMVSFWLCNEKPKEYYIPEYHGKVFTLSEITTMIREKGLPEGNWITNLPEDFPPYIEAQVWDQKPLWDAYEKLYQRD